MKKTIGLLIALLILLAALFVAKGFIHPQKGPGPVIPGRPDVPTMCTMEAKLCPDGSYVGRSGPKCEFAACPSAPSTNQPPSAPVSDYEKDVRLSVGQSTNVPGLYITLNKVSGDSRCPVDVTCIWAGSVTGNVTLINQVSQIETIDISSVSQPQNFGDFFISITAVSPAPNSKKSITQSDYNVTFHISYNKNASIK